MFTIYTPNQICLPYVEEVRRYYLSRPEWENDVREGKMFGVLVHDSGYLAAFSGTLGGKTNQPGFVPPVYDLMADGGRFLDEEAEISRINRRISELETRRVSVRNGGATPLFGADGREIAELRHERKSRSQALQRWLFSQYSFLNIKGQRRTLTDIFGTIPIPSASGDCCAPKLLQEAFRRGLTPRALVEWYSTDNRFYPPCTQRCRPILSHMLSGMESEQDPELERHARLQNELKTVYEDNYVIVVVKPSGLLSVPGKEFLPSVDTITGGFSVHRLDQDTSGLMILAKTLDAQIELRRQFERREVAKIYDAILERPMPEGQEGNIDLRLAADIENRPRQVVDPVRGKSTSTHYKVVGDSDGHAHVRLFPSTGRTHQLRVHCASVEGLANPILNDRLYGNVLSQHGTNQLRLNASYIRFVHPVTGKDMEFSCIPIWLENRD